MLTPLRISPLLASDGNRAGPEGLSRQVRTKRPGGMTNFAIRVHESGRDKKNCPSSASSGQEPRHSDRLFLNDKSAYCSQTRDKLFEKR